MKKFKIEVTYDDINKGVPCHGNKCAIAQAISRVLPGLHVNVSGLGIILRKPIANHEFLFELPYEGQEFIRLYDIGQGLGKSLVDPFSFELVMGDDAYEKLMGKEYVQLGMFDVFDFRSQGLTPPSVATADTQLQLN